MKFNNIKENIKEWFSYLENVLKSELESAVTIGHKLSKGELRELFVGKILERFLPWGVSIGSGEIYSSHSQKLYWIGKWGIRLEDDVIIKKDRCEQVTNVPKDPILI